DDDDEWLPTKLEKQVTCFTDPEVGLSYTGAWLINTDHKVKYEVLPTIDGWAFKDLLIENKIGTTNTVMLRTDVAKQLLFDETLPGRQDYDLWLRVAKRYKIKGINECLVNVYGRKGLKRITSDVRNYETAIEIINEKFKSDIDSMDSNRRIFRESEQLFFLGAQGLKANNIEIARKYFLKSFMKKKRIK